MSNKEKITLGFWKEEFDVTKEDLLYLEDLKNKKIQEIKSSNIGNTLRERMSIANWIIVFLIIFIVSPIPVSLFFSMLNMHSPILNGIGTIATAYFLVKKYFQYIKSDDNASKIFEKQKKSATKEAEKEFYDEVLMKKAFYCKHGLVQIQDGDIEYFQELLKNNKRNKAEKLFYIEKIDTIPIYGTTEGLNVLDNIGFASYTETNENNAYDKAKYDAYIKGANALLVSDANTSTYTTTNSYFNGIGAKRGIESKVHSNFNLSVNFLKIKYDNMQ